MRFATIGSVTLHYHLRGGDRPLLVFVNSLGTDFRIWRQVAPEFEDRFSVLCYDKRGHGLSDLGAPPYAMADHVDDLSGLVDHVGAKQVVVCGLSVGGLIAQGLFDRRPGMVRALVLCDTAHRIGTMQSWNERIDAVKEHGVASVADGVLEKWFTPHFHQRRRADLAGCRNMLVRQPAEGYAGTCAAIRDADHTDMVKRITVPTLCMAGDQDGATPPELVRSMAELIPGAEFSIVEGAGHIPCVEKPAELVALMKDFLERNGVSSHG
ncbi:MAG: catD 1 [Rhizobiaceae bacterium]|nr:catD 1 [Rhizobiaceae bacterium]